MKGVGKMNAKKSSGLFRMQNYWTWILYSIAVALIALMQVSPRFFPEIAYARPTPLVLMVVCVALLEGPTVGSIMGMVAGLLWDMHSFRIFGYYGLMLMGIGLVIGLLVQWLLRANFLSAMLMCVCGVIVYTVLDWLICYVLFLNAEMFDVLVRVYAPNALYTILLSPLAYGVVLCLARFLRRHKNAR